MTDENIPTLTIEKLYEYNCSIVIEQSLLCYKFYFFKHRK